MDFNPGATGPVIEVTTPILKVWGWVAGGAWDDGGGAGAAEDDGGGAGAAEDDGGGAGAAEDDGGGAGAAEVDGGADVVGVLGAQALNKGKDASASKRIKMPRNTEALFI